MAQFPPHSRRRFLALIASLAPCRPALKAEEKHSIRGKLRQSGPPAIATGGKSVLLLGDEGTMKVLNDERIGGTDFEAVGRWLDQSGTPARFEIDGIHTRSLFVHQNGKRLMVTYWCDVCYIRTYSPGICWCCQKNTDLELLESVKD